MPPTHSAARTAKLSGGATKWTNTPSPPAISSIFSTVPSPGLSRSGIQPSITTALIISVTVPNSPPLMRAMPCESTVHGVEPSRDTTSMPSPKPNRLSVTNSTASGLASVNGHIDEAVHGVTGRMRE